MNAEDLYDEEDMTPEELEEYHHDPSFETIPTYTPNVKKWVLDFENFPNPDNFDKDRFMRRKPAMNITSNLIKEIRGHYHSLPPVQQRFLFKSLQSKMLTALISTSGANTIDKLLDILQAEIDSGIPAPIPEWYEWSNKRFGPRSMGYQKCENRGCFQTDTLSQKLERCGKCKLAFYCSRECQVADWKGRHKKVCKHGSDRRDQHKKVSDLLNMFAEKFDG